MILGGGILTVYGDSKSWGVNPAAANGTVLMNYIGGAFPAFTLEIGKYIAYSFDSFATFHGVVSEITKTASDPSSGVAYNFTVLDNRIRLAWQWVFAAYNMEDDPTQRRFGRPEAPIPPGDSGTGGGDDDLDFGSGLGSSGGLDGAGTVPPGEDNPNIRRRFWSILPQHQKSGIRTWHDIAFTARQILNFSFEGAWGDYGFSRSYHPDLDDAVLIGLDYRNGIRLSGLVAEINEKSGMEVTISGARSLRWDRKGEGLPPIPEDGTTNRSNGEAITTNDTKIRVIGERVRVQVVNVELEPDWKPGWEKFIDELAWRREVADAFELAAESKADQADLSAKVRQLTVWEYAKKKNDPALLDYRRYGDISRNRMAAWSYIQEFVYRSYRIPPDRDLYGVPMSSLEMADSLICATDIEGEGEATKQVYATDPVEFYPTGQAQVIHRGQPLDLIQSRDIRLFYRNTTGDFRDQWTTATDFEVDPSNMSIRFGAPVFIDGLPSEGKSIYLKLNKGEGGGTNLSSIVPEGSDYLDVIVPNPGYEITAAAVKASFCFLMAPYQKDYGSGPRRGALSMPGLGLHLLDTTTVPFSTAGVAEFSNDDAPFPDAAGRTFKEVLYQDGGSAEEKADAAAASALALSPIQATGGFKRHGVCGTALSGAVDRIAISVTQDGGITEDITYTKARATGVAFSERTLTRIQRTEELYPGQQELRNEIRQYRALAAALRKPGRLSLNATHRMFDDVFTRPVGAENPSTTTVYDKDEVAPTRGGLKQWRAGDILWLDGKGVPSETGKAFGGILISKPAPEGEAEDSIQTKTLAVATRGIVPVRVRGAITAGSYVLADKGSHYGAATGDTTIGMLMHGDDVPVPPDVGGEPAEMLVMVSLGGGGAGSVPGICPFGEIISYSETDGSDSSATSKTGIRGGVLVAGDKTWNVPHRAIDLSETGEFLIWIKVLVTANTDPEGIAVLSGLKTSEEPTWENGSASDDYEVKIIPVIFPTSAPGSGVLIVPVGILTVEDDKATLVPAGCGNITATHCPGVLDFVRGGTIGGSDG